MNTPLSNLDQVRSDILEVREKTNLLELKLREILELLLPQKESKPEESMPGESNAACVDPGWLTITLPFPPGFWEAESVQNIAELAVYMLRHGMTETEILNRMMNRGD